MREIAEHPLVDELRLNTIVPRNPRHSHYQALETLLEACGDKPLLVDLKGRQLRITKYADPWLNFVDLSHEIEVETPCALYFRRGQATIRAVKGNKLMLTDCPEEVLGAGQAVNILHPSLRIKGFLTEDDLGYREAAKALGIHKVALSFTEEASDITEYREFDPDAEIWAKIESERGMELVERSWDTLKKDAHIMIARGDLYDNAGEDRTRYLRWERTLLHHDPDAIMASRILQSCEDSEVPSLEDLRELEYLFTAGVKTLMLADGVARKITAFRRAMKAYEQFLHYWETDGHRIAEEFRLGVDGRGITPKVS